MRFTSIVFLLIGAMVLCSSSIAVEDNLSYKIVEDAFSRFSNLSETKQSEAHVKYRVTTYYAPHTLIQDQEQDVDIRKKGNKYYYHTEGFEMLSNTTQIASVIAYNKTITLRTLGEKGVPQIALIRFPRLSNYNIVDYKEEASATYDHVLQFTPKEETEESLYVKELWCYTKEANGRFVAFVTHYKDGAKIDKVRTEVVSENYQNIAIGIPDGDMKTLFFDGDQLKNKYSGYEFLAR